MSKINLNVAVIGKNNQAARHIQILKSLPFVRLTTVLTHKPGNDPKLPLSTRFSDVLSADAIVIASPTATHAGYLRRLKNYKGYILIEKPAVSTLAQSKVLRKWPISRKKKVRINFNLSHSRLFESFKKVLRGHRIGKPISLDIHTSQGLAFKSSYFKSWRGQAGKSAGVLENVGIHYLYMLLTLFGPPKSVDADFLWAASSPKKSPPDTAVLRFKSKEGLLVTLRHSYAAPMRVHWFLLGTNGYWEYDGNVARLYSPRDTFDAAGRFTVPPVVSQEACVFPLMWKESLTRAVRAFLNVVRKKGSFDPKEFDRGLASMETISGVTN